jgi:hypothetical protein
MGMLRGCFASSIVGIVGRRVQVAGRQAVAHFIVSVVIEPAVGVVRFFQSRQRVVHVIDRHRPRRNRQRRRHCAGGGDGRRVRHCGGGGDGRRQGNSGCQCNGRRGRYGHGRRLRARGGDGRNRRLSGVEVPKGDAMGIDGVLGQQSK